MERYLLISVIIIGLFVLGYLVYLALSSRQRDIEAEIKQVNDMLEKDESGEVLE